MVRLCPQAVAFGRSLIRLTIFPQAPKSESTFPQGKVMGAEDGGGAMGHGSGSTRNV